MISARQKLKLVLFLFGNGLLAAVLLVLFTRDRLFETTNVYYVRVPDDVNGLEQGSVVAVHGVTVGKVHQIELYADDTESVRLMLDIDHQVPIYNDSHATLSLRGVTGLKYVDISGGHEATGLRPPNGYIPYETSTLDKVTDQAATLITQAGRLFQTTDKLVAQIARVADRLDEQRIDAIVTETNQAVQRFEAAGAELELLLRQTRSPLLQTVRSADAAFQGAAQASTEAKQTLASMNAAALELRNTIQQNEDQLRASANNLREATQSFKYLGRELRQQPSRLLLSATPPQRQLP